jgi:hypothetical protein
MIVMTTQSLWHRRLEDTNLVLSFIVISFAVLDVVLIHFFIFRVAGTGAVVPFGSDLWQYPRTDRGTVVDNRLDSCTILGTEIRVPVRTWCD